jgi:hypothetical protein
MFIYAMENLGSEHEYHFRSSQREADTAFEDDTVGKRHLFRAALSLLSHEGVLSGINQAFAASGTWPLTAVKVGAESSSKPLTWECSTARC